MDRPNKPTDNVRVLTSATLRNRAVLKKHRLGKFKRDISPTAPSSVPAGASVNVDELFYRIGKIAEIASDIEQRLSLVEEYHKKIIPGLLELAEKLGVLSTKLGKKVP